MLILLARIVETVLCLRVALTPEEARARENELLDYVFLHIKHVAYCDTFVDSSGFKGILRLSNSFTVCVRGCQRYSLGLALLKRVSKRNDDMTGSILDKFPFPSDLPINGAPAQRHNVASVAHLQRWQPSLYVPRGGCCVMLFFLQFWAR